MNYLTMFKSAVQGDIALVVDGISYTYGNVVELAEKKGMWLKRKIGTSEENGDNVLVIKEGDILSQLVSFLACYVCGYIPLLVPADYAGYANYSFVPDLEIPREVCMAVSTSGTSGKAKIYFRSYESWADFFDIQNSIFGINSRTRIFAQGSLAFTGNLNIYMGVFFAGGTVVAQNDFIPKKWQNIIEDEGVNAIYLIPSKLMLMPKVVRKACEKVKSVISGSQSLGRHDAELLKEIFINSDVILYYGASELSYISYVSYRDMTEDRNLVGRPFPDVEVFVENDDIYVNTPYHVEGIECPYSLNDTGYFDGEGMLHFVGRSDDIINIRGRKISCLKIENVLMELPFIQDVCVVAAENKDGRDKQILAAVKLAEEKSAVRDEITEHLRKRLAKFEIPKKIYFVDEIPKNESGKNDRKNVLALFCH